MIPYFVRVMLSSALLLLAYRLLLEREKMFVFNRFFLLFSVVFSFVIPLFTMTVRIPAAAGASGYVISGEEFHDKVGATEGSRMFWVYIFSVYGAMVLFRLLRFMKNLGHLVRKIRKGSVIAYRCATLILTADEMAPHSFLNYIFVDKHSFENGKVKEEILHHEWAHVRQRHSLDIMWIELLLVFCWFNPFFYLYRKAIRLNHEFLADDAVISECPDVAAYQYLLLDSMQQQPGLSITSTLTYSITKARFMMMTKQTSRRVARLRAAALVPFCAVAIFLFMNRVAAQTPIRPVGVVARKIDTSKLEVVMLPNKPLPRIVPTPEQLKAWENAGMYGVWINGKKVQNEQLQQFVNTDFDQVFISKLARNTIHYADYYYQVDLMTRDYYEAYYQDALSHPMIKGYRPKKRLGIN